MSRKFYILSVLMLLVLCLTACSDEDPLRSISPVAADIRDHGEKAGEELEEAGAALNHVKGVSHDDAINRLVKECAMTETKADTVLSAWEQNKGKVENKAQLEELIGTLDCE